MSGAAFVAPENWRNDSDAHCLRTAHRNGNSRFRQERPITPESENDLTWSQTAAPLFNRGRQRSTA